MAVQPDEAVLITADTATDPSLPVVLLTAVERADARGSILTIPRLPYQGRLADPYVPPVVAGAVAECAVWIDLTFPYLAGSRVCDEALGSDRVRYLLGGDMGCAGLARLFGGVDLDVSYEVHRAFDELTAASLDRAVRITDRRGSDVTFTLAKPGFTKPRRADRAGPYFVPGSGTMFPAPETVRGTLSVVAAFHERYARFAEPITLVVDGRIRAAAGGGADRVVLERALRRAAGGDWGHVIHFTHGIHPPGGPHDRRVVHRGHAQRRERRSRARHPVLAAGRRREPPGRDRDRAVRLDRRAEDGGGWRPRRSAAPGEAGRAARAEALTGATRGRRP